MSLFNIWKERITFTVQLVQIQVHVHLLWFTDCTDVTSAVYQNFRFGVANEVLKYADMSSAKGSKADSGAKKRLRKKKTLELIKSLDGSLYKHFVTRDPQPSTSPTATSRPINPSRESIVDAHAGAADQSSLVCAGGLRRADYVDADMESDWDRGHSNFDIIDTEVHYGARADDETADATKSISLSNLSSFEEGQRHQYQPYQVGLMPILPIYIYNTSKIKIDSHFPLLHYLHDCIVLICWYWWRIAHTGYLTRVHALMSLRWLPDIGLGLLGVWVSYVHQCTNYE